MKTSLSEPPFVEISIPTADGNFIADYSEKGLAKLAFPRTKTSRVASENPRASVIILRWHRLTCEALKQMLAGRVAKNLPPLDWTGRTEFQQAVWRALLKVTLGNTLSYGEIAERIGRPKAFRAVGSACGANPIPILVPCHRVLAADKKLGGFTSGLDWKRDLLQREGVVWQTK